MPVRVAEERNRDAGVLGHLSFTADRGPLRAAVEGESLVVRTDITAHAEACARGRCYASCAPVAVATVTIPLRLTPDWRLGRSRVAVGFTRGCVVRVLGGLLSVDVTPILEGEIGGALRRLERDIDARLPDLRGGAERLWTELAAPRPLPLGGCIRLRPRAFVQGPVAGAGANLRARLALVAAPELFTRCHEDEAPAGPLPPLAQEPAIPDAEAVVVGLAMPLASALGSIAPGPQFDLSGASTRIGRARGTAAGPAIDVDLTLEGATCGDVAVRALPAWADDGSSLRLAAGELTAAEASRLAAASLDPGSAARTILEGARIAPPLTPELLRETIPRLASALPGRADVHVSVRVAEARPLSAFARGEDLVATVRLLAGVEIRLPAAALGPAN